MPEYLWIRDDLVQKFGVGEDGRVDLLEFVSIAYRIEQCLVCVGKLIQVLSATIVGGQLRAGVSASGLLGRGSIYRVLHILSKRGDDVGKVGLFFCDVFIRELWRHRTSHEAFLSHGARVFVCF